MGNGGISARTWPEVPSEILKKDRKRDSPGKDRKKLPLAPGTLSTSVKRESLPKMEKRAMQLPDDIFTLDASQPRNPETKIHYAVESPTVPMTPKTPKMPAVVDASVHHDCAPRSRSNSKSISTTSSVNKITLKVILQSQSGRRSDTRKLVLPAITCATGLPTVAYGQLMDMVRQKFADRLVPSKVLLKYMDEDDDLITLTNQMDVDDFFQMNLENLNRLSISSREGASNMTLRLYVEGTDEDAEYKCTDSSLWTPQGSWSTATRVKGLGHWPQSLSQSLRLPSPPKSEEDLSSGLPEIRTQSPVPEPRKHSPEPRKHSPELSPCLKELVELESNCGANPRSTRRKKRNVSKCSTSDTEAGFPNAGQFLSHHLPERPSRQWSIGRLLGSGACAKVYRGMYTDNGQLVAVKQVEIQKQDQQNPYVQEDLTNLDREISSLRTLDHPMIVRYLGMEIDEREDMDFTVVNIFMELVGGASIACLLSEMGPFSEQVCQSYTCQILIGLGYLHDNDIVHRDIKGANIMVDRRGNIKLTDFGAAKRIADMLSKAEGGAASNLKGTIKWMAPEVCLGGGGSKASDVWSLGCTVVEMATGGSPFPDNDNQFSILFNIGMGKCDPLIPKSLSQAAQDFLQQCFQQDPSCRPTVASLKRHEWLSPAFVNFSQETLKSGDEKMKRSSDSSELSKVGSDLSWDRLSHIKPWQVHVRVPRYCTDSDSSSPQNRRSPFNSSNSPLGTEVSSIIASNESLFNTRQSMVSADCSVVVDQEALAGRFDIGQTFIFGAPAADCVRNSMESVSH